MAYRIRGLEAGPFRHLYGLSAAQLSEFGAVRYSVNAETGFPDRIEMRDMRPGETALLLNYVHMPLASPYRASHAIFVREGADEPYDEVDRVPQMMARRIMSLRAFDKEGFIQDADIATGDAIEQTIRSMLANERTAFIHAHNAKHGCYFGVIERA